MENLYLDHPTEETLERFLLHHSAEDEVDIVETHVLACESCVARLETLETQIAVTKTALEQLEREKSRRVPVQAQSLWKNWFTVPKLSWAGAAAALVLGVALAPQIRHRDEPVEVYLSAYRGSGATLVPEGHALDVRLNTNDLPAGPLQVEIVDRNGTEVWTGRAVIHHDQIQVNVPSIKEKGVYFLRLYNPALLREFAFQVK